MLFRSKTHTSLTFVVVPATVALRIYECVPVDYHELVSCVEETDREFAVMLIRNVKREFADFGDLIITDSAERCLQALRRNNEPADAV